MPMTAPLASTSAPPELPGLIGASVCTALMTALVSLPSPARRTGRSSALTMPLVTVPARPSGEPMATTGSPTTTSSELPSDGGDQAGLLDLEDGDVAGRVAADDAGRRAAAVGEDRADLGALDAVGAGDDVVVGDDVAVRRRR